MKKMENMGGFFVAAVTPYDEAGRFSAAALHKLMDKTIAEGAAGFLIGGSSAECPMLTHEERVEGLEAAAHYAHRGSTRLIASVAAISTQEAKDYARTAAALGYDAIISTVPYYYKFGMKGIAGYFRALRETVDLPLFLYNFPGNTASRWISSIPTSARCSPTAPWPASSRPASTCTSSSAARHEPGSGALRRL